MGEAKVVNTDPVLRFARGSRLWRSQGLLWEAQHRPVSDSCRLHMEISNGWRRFGFSREGTLCGILVQEYAREKKKNQIIHEKSKNYKTPTKADAIPWANAAWTASLQNTSSMLVRNAIWIRMTWTKRWWCMMISMRKSSRRALNSSHYPSTFGNPIRRIATTSAFFHTGINLQHDVCKIELLLIHVHFLKMFTSNSQKIIMNKKQYQKQLIVHITLKVVSIYHL